ncbi:MAG: hypothetical protein WCK31_04795 [bacterium]
MEKVKITAEHKQLLPSVENFDSYEFYIAANPDHEFDCPVALIVAAQIIRNWVGFSVSITSTSRPHDTFGFHRTDEAIDLLSASTIHGEPPPKEPAEVLEEFKEECLSYISGTGSKLIEDLRKAGVTGFGVEQVCIHLDCRTNSFGRRDAYGQYMVFEYKQDKNGKILVNKAL